MDAIVAEQVSYSYQNQDGHGERVLNRISLRVPEGEFLVVIGPSGSGKSTLLSILAGLREPEEGQAEILGERVEGPDTRRGVVFQHYSLFPWMTAKENVVFGIRQARAWSKSEAKERAEHFLERVGLKDAGDKYPFQLSGGMQQRAAIARMLAMDAAVFLMDEPFGAVDARARRSLQELLESLWQQAEKKKTVFFVTHDLDEALLLADRIVFLDKGEIQDEIRIPFGRPRDREKLSEEGYCTVRRRLAKLFQEDF